MKHPRIAVGIDIGTYTIKVVVAEEPRAGTTGASTEKPRILGTGMARSKGLRHGYIVNAAEMERSLKQALAQAQKEAGVPITRAYLAIGGIGLEELHVRTEIMVSRADATVTDLDVRALTEACEERARSRLQNRKILHVIPIEYRLDGARVLGRPAGMQGVKLGGHVLFVTAIEQHLDDLIAAVEDVGVSIVDVMASPIAGSFVTLTKAQKIAGCVLANIGAETLSVVVFENNIPISLKIFPTGSTDVTNDIALGLKVSLDDAEEFKRGSYPPALANRKKIDDIVERRLKEMFQLIENHLAALGKNELLPAGVIITGGGSGVATIEDIARATLKLPTKKAAGISGAKGIAVKDASWAVSYGLTIWGLSVTEEGSGIAIAKQAGSSLLRWFSRFLP